MVLDPLKTFFDPIGSVCQDGMMETGVYKMFKVENLGISEESCSYDDSMLKRFNDCIVLEDNKYKVSLPWKENVGEERSNYHVSKQILD